jgi:ferredoxin-NADP reductase
MESAPESASQAPIGALAGRLAKLADRFAWPLQTSHYLGLLNPRWGTHALQATVEGLRDETRDVRTLTLRPGRGWRAHRAGQHVAVGVTIGGAIHWRTFSISSVPDPEDGCITITVKAIPDGRVSRHLVYETQPGAQLLLSVPQGEFVLPEATPVRAVFVSGGSGITPLMSMLRHRAACGDVGDIVHVHYLRTPEDLIFSDELLAFEKGHPRYRLHLVTTRAAGETGIAGRFRSAQLDRLCPDWTEREAYACGPQTLLADIEAHWKGAALTHRLHIERFHAALAATPADAAGGRVRFARSNREVEADGCTNLLRIAEGAGLRPRHGCRMGICHSCTVTLRAGCVRDLRNDTLTNEPGSRVQICVCAAAGDVELEA